MKEALLVIDYQNYILDYINQKEVLNNIQKLVNLFEQEEQEIIFVKNIVGNDDVNEEIQMDIKEYPVFEKKNPNAFSNNNLYKYLQQRGIERLLITGFNIEYCCLFTSIVASHLGFHTTMIEDACGTTGDENSYEMPGLDIVDFVGTILNWSDYVEVLYYDEYIEQKDSYE